MATAVLVGRGLRLIQGVRYDAGLVVLRYVPTRVFSTGGGVVAVPMPFARDLPASAPA
jgi:hypothetical protein